MDDKTKEVIISGAIANLPLIVATAQQLMSMAVKLAESVDMTPDQIEASWQSARSEGRMRRAQDLPDAVVV